MITRSRQAMATAVAAITAFACLALAGCKASDGAADQPIRTASPSAESVTAPCVDLAEFPSLPVADLIGRLPVEGVDKVSYVQAELHLTRGQGACSQAPAPLVGDPCRVLTGSVEATTNVILWRSADTFAEQLFASGARELIAEDMTGRAQHGDGVFRYRMTAIRYADDATAATSPVLAIVKDCGALSPDGRLTLSAGAEPFLVAYQDRAQVVLIEGRIGSMDQVSGKYPGTASGLLPQPAFSVINSWWQQEVGRVR